MTPREIKRCKRRQPRLKGAKRQKAAAPTQQSSVAAQCG